jgi:F0F1-type ATP synthase membrane subunit b/b'
VALAHGPEDSFMSVINLLEEIIDVTSSTNNRPISVSLRSASSDNELLKARLAQERLSQEEKSRDALYAAMQEQIRLLATNLVNLNLSTIRFAEILEMLKEELKLFSELKKNWDDLVLSFSSFSDQVTTSFRLKFESFFGTTGSNLDTKVSATDQKLFLEIIKEDSADLYHESYVLFVLSRTYYDVSSKYLMPRAAGLSSMLTSSNNNERQELLAKLQQDTEDVQKKIKELIDEQRKKYKKTISKKRAKINEIIDHQGADGNEMDIIEQGKKLLEIDD